MDLKIESETIEDVLVLRVLSDRVRYEDSSDFGERVETEIQQGGAKHVLLSMKDVAFLTSDVLGKIVAFQQQVHENGGQFKVVLRNSSVLEIFKITQLDKVLELFSSEKEALSSIQG